MDTNQTNGVPVAVEYRDGQGWINSRELHKALESGQQYADWIKNRLEKYDFIEGEDYISVQKNMKREIGATRSTDYLITIDAAKELAMLENNDAGRRIRRYFIGIEKASRELAAKFRELGGLDRVLADAALARILLLFANRRSLDMRQVYHIIDLALSKSSLTGEYIMAKDVARAVREPGRVDEMSESFIERIVPEIRRIVAETGRVPSIAREKNGDYKALLASTEARHE